MITLMAFSVNRSNMGRGLVQVTTSYQGWWVWCGLRPWVSKSAVFASPLSFFVVNTTDVFIQLKQ